MHKYVILFSLTFGLPLFAMEQQKKPLTIYSIPGQNGAGSGSVYIDQIVLDAYPYALPANQRWNIVDVQTPSFPYADLGQDQCIKLLKQAIKDKPSDNGLIYATSQGTATALNYLAHAESHDHIKALVLESTLASGNSGIRHTMRNLLQLGSLTNAPAGYYWNPYVAKVQYPLYWPGGKQAIKSVEHIVNTDKPIIIIHDKQDPQLSFDDACALYYGLRKNGNNNTYFLQCDRGQHLYLLRYNPELKPALTTILAKHGILPSNSRSEVDVAPYQPNPEQFKKQYEELRAQETKHEAVKYGLLAAATLAVGKLLYKRVPSFLANIALKRASSLQSHE